MSKGPGNAQRAILAAISTPQATASHSPAGTNPFDAYEVGPIGVSFEEIYSSIYSTTEPTRAQRHSVSRAIRTLCDRGQAQMYPRGRERQITTSRALRSVIRYVVGRPRNEWETREYNRRLYKRDTRPATDQHRGDPMTSTEENA